MICHYPIAPWTLGGGFSKNSIVLIRVKIKAMVRPPPHMLDKHGGAFYSSTQPGLAHKFSRPDLRPSWGFPRDMHPRDTTFITDLLTIDREIEHVPVIAHTGLVKAFEL